MSGPLTGPASDDEMVEAFPDQVRKLTSARERYEGNKARLCREDGQPVYSEAEHKTRHDALVAQEHADVKSVEVYLQSVIDRVDHDPTHLDAFPADSLTPQLAEANGRREFVNEDVGSMRFDALAARVRAILERGSGPRAFLYARAVERKLAALADAGRQGRARALLLAEEQVLRDLDPLLDQLLDKVRGGPADPNRCNDLLRRRTVAQLAAHRADRMRAFAGGGEAQWQRSMAERVRQLRT